ncbi:MAG TPA: hypothetical protein VH814_12470 [Steroidobacteraceae bacterium]|jgi:hypothetical protein
MTFTPSFYRSLAVCSIVSAITTLGLIYLPEFYQPIEGFEGRMRRVDDPAYVLRSWVYLVHPFLTFAAALGVALRIRTVRSAAAVIGIAGFALWASNEAAQQTLTLFAFDKWRAAYFAADEATRAIIRTNTALYDGLWDAMYFLLLIGFSIGNTSLGVGLLRAGKGVTRVVGCFFLGAVAITLPIITGELQWWTMPEPLASWSYPAVQPLGRTLIGLWLWSAAREDESLPTRFRLSPAR